MVDRTRKKQEAEYRANRNLWRRTIAAQMMASAPWGDSEEQIRTVVYWAGLVVDALEQEEDFECKRREQKMPTCREE